MTIDALTAMIGRTYSADKNATALITHASYFHLLHQLLSCFSEICKTGREDLFWKVADGVMKVLLVYKFADTFPRESVLE